MSFKRFAALALSVLMLLTVLPELLPAAQAAPSTDGCTSPNAPNGKHYWGAGNYKDPWCTTPGGTTYRCRYCKKEVFEQSSPALGHNWSPWETVDEATCTEKGLRTRYCLRCYVDVEEEIPALGHYFPNPWTVAKAPTCEEAGQEVNYCVRCNYEWRRPLEAIGHDWDEGVITKAPTAAEDGEKTYTCKNDPSHTKTEVIPAGTVPDETAHPALYAKIDSISPYKEVYEPDDMVKVVLSVTNTGNVPICPELHTKNEYYQGKNNSGYFTFINVLGPGESMTYPSQFSASAIGDYIKPGTDTAGLLGIATSDIYFIGYADADHSQNTENEMICESNHVEIGLKVHNPEDDGPHSGLTIQWIYDKVGTNAENEINTTEPGVLDWYSWAFAHYTVANSGNVPLNVVSYATYANGESSVSHVNHGAEIAPGNSVEDYWGNAQISKFITPGTETPELYGTVTLSFYCVGYATDTYESSSNPGAELCRTETVTRTWKIGKDDGPHPQLTLTASWADDAGEGKRYEGAEVDVNFSLKNTGDCSLKIDFNYAAPIDSVTVSSGTLSLPCIVELEPNEAVSWSVKHSVTSVEVEQGKISYSSYRGGYYKDADGNEKIVYSNFAQVNIPLTYPDGEEPEEAKPGLTLTWDFDVIFRDSKSSTTTNPGILNPDDWAIAIGHLTNTGNVGLRIERVFTLGDGYTSPPIPEYDYIFPAGETMTNLMVWTGNVSKVITPGTETEELLGTVTVTIYYIGYDPETGEELCRSNEITRTWKIGKESGWEIPEDSKLEGTLAVAPGYESSDPAGYQLGEEIETVLTVENTGLIDLDTFGVSDPRDSTNFSDGPIAVSEEKSYVRAHVTVTEEDVERGYIEFPMITITWTDPDSEKERPTFAGPLTVTVLKKTGLLLKKGVAFGPEDGDYFKEGEPIQWSLTVTNNSKDSITDVTVEDKGKTVGSYAEITPGDTKNCTVPVHIVTEYDAKVVGYVLNSATATGTDYRGAVRTWPSNVAKALTKKPTVPGEDPKGDLEGLHPAITITKAEDPHGPLNGSYYEANEAIDYIITIKNVGDTELKDVAVTDSLAGFAPIGTLASLAPGEEKTFTYSYTVKDSDLPFGWVYNSATVTYTFGDNVKGTPKTSDTVQSKVGDDPFPPETPHLDPEKLPNDEDYCSLTLDTLGDTEARYTLHACAEHTEAAIAAEEAAQSGDWAAAAELWSAEVESLYETLYEAADSELKAALVAEKAAYDDYVDGLAALSHEAAAKELRVKSAFLCCALHTAPEELESSLAGDYAQSMGGETETESARAFGPLTGSDSEVTETYAGRIAYAQKNVLGLMDIEKSYDWDEVFDRGVQLWQSALDSEVNPIYKAADKETRKQIALWRISLDTLSAAEKPFLTLLYEGNNNAITETQMNLYKDAAFVTSYLK